jgi:hypothetical protein
MIYSTNKGLNEIDRQLKQDVNLALDREVKDLEKFNDLKIKEFREHLKDNKQKVQDRLDKMVLENEKRLELLNQDLEKLKKTRQEIEETLRTSPNYN